MDYVYNSEGIEKFYLPDQRLFINVIYKNKS